MADGYDDWEAGAGREELVAALDGVARCEAPRYGPGQWDVAEVEALELDGYGTAIEDVDFDIALAAAAGTSADGVVGCSAPSVGPL